MTVFFFYWKQYSLKYGVTHLPKWQIWHSWWRYLAIAYTHLKRKTSISLLSCFLIVYPCSYCRKFGVKCSRCGDRLLPREEVMRVQSHVFHLQCFVCVVCCQPLVKGAEFMLRGGQLFCKQEFEKELFMMQQASPSGTMRKILLFFHPSFKFLHIELVLLHHFCHQHYVDDLWSLENQI